MIEYYKLTLSGGRICLLFRKRHRELLGAKTSCCNQWLPRVCVFISIHHTVLEFCSFV